MAEGFAQVFSAPVYTSSSFSFSTSSAGPGYHLHGELLAGVSSQQPLGGKGRGWGCWRRAEGRSPSSKAKQGWPTEGSCLIRLPDTGEKEVFSHRNSSLLSLPSDLQTSSKISSSKEETHCSAGACLLLLEALVKTAYPPMSISTFR